ncbi:MAG: polysaccharide pyruvyl transferase family protein [Pseudomonadota bacterium]
MSQSPLPPVTIALMWHSMNSDNLGVGALTLSNMALLRRAAAEAGRSPQFIALGWRDPRPWYEEFDDLENVPLRTRHLPRPGGPLGDAIKRSDIVFDIGGGDSFTDIYGPKRFGTIWITKWRSVMAGKPLILSPQTVGPFESTWARVMARRIMNRARVVVTRDLPSTKFLQELGVTAEMMEATDVAMGLPYTPPAPRTGGKIRVGLNVSGLMFSGGYTQDNQFGLKSDYPTLIRRIVKYFAEMPDVELHLVGHVQSKEQPLEDDHRVGTQIASEFPGVIVSPWFKSPSEAKTYIADMDFFMGARMHATIAAFSSNVPVIPMAYSRKFAGVFGTLGYEHVADCKTESEEEIMARIVSGFENRDTLKTEVIDAMTRVNARLDAYVSRAAEEIRKV